MEVSKHPGKEKGEGRDLHTSDSLGQRYVPRSKLALAHLCGIAYYEYILRILEQLLKKGRVKLKQVFRNIRLI